MLTAFLQQQQRVVCRFKQKNMQVRHLLSTLVWPSAEIESRLIAEISCSGNCIMHALPFDDPTLLSEGIIKQITVFFTNRRRVYFT